MTLTRRVSVCYDGAALIIVLAFVVLLSAIVIAYLSRTTADRPLADASFGNAAANQLARSALAIVTANFKQEIANGSTPPTPDANIVPQRSGNDPSIPNMVRRSVRNDAIAVPGVPSLASSVNSTSDLSLNGRYVSAARWNKHYLIPRDPTLYGGGTASNVGTDPLPQFVAPDWVIVTDAGPTILATPNASVVGRYAYVVYDEGGVLDMNVAGFPSANSNNAAYLSDIGRKGVLALADITTTGLSFSAIDNIVGWRNYYSAQPTRLNNKFVFTTNPTAFVTYFLDRSRDFGFVNVPAGYYQPTGVPLPIDQSFFNRAQLLELRRTLTADQDAMQYLGTSSRGLNRSTWTTSGTLLAGRFPLGRFDLFGTTPPAAADAASLRTQFGVTYVAKAGTTEEHWQYLGPAGATLLSSIPAVAGINQDPPLPSLLSYALPASNIGDILSIVASLIDQRDSNNETTWIEYADASNPAGPPLKAFGVDNTASIEPGAPTRPATVVVLNRAFRNVGEIGYGYRNGTTSINFRTANSVDAPLLDLFTYNTAATRSGQVSLNTRNVAVLAAVIKGAYANTTGNPINGPDATSAATKIVAETTVSPATGRKDIARLASIVTNTPFSADEEKNETIARALSEVSQTRTWNLMIDVIAQSGRYPSTATTAADLTKFVTKAEKRYWLHIAIDRFTGDVIDQQLEAVYE
jgi:hypothetical protein